MRGGQGSGGLCCLVVSNDVSASRHSVNDLVTFSTCTYTFELYTSIQATARRQFYCLGSCSYKVQGGHLTTRIHLPTPNTSIKRATRPLSTFAKHVQPREPLWRSRTAVITTASLITWTTSSAFARLPHSPTSFVQPRAQGIRRWKHAWCSSALRRRPLYAAAPCEEPG